MWKTSDLTTTFEISDPDTGETANVTIKRLSEGNRMQLQSALTPGMSLSAYMVEQRRLAIELSIVAWTLPLDIADAKELDPRIIGKIHEQVTLFNPGIYPTALSDDERAKRALHLSEVVRAFLADDNDGEVTTADLLAALEAYDGDDVPRPTEQP